MTTPAVPERRAPAQPTLDEVARQAGVSKSTASKVLNGRKGISPETREAVMGVVQRLGYAPSTGARAAQLRPSVLVVFSTLLDLYAMHILQGLVSTATAEGVDVVVTHVPTGPHASPGVTGAAGSPGQDGSASADEPTGAGVDFARALRQGHIGVIGVTTAFDDAQTRACADAGLPLVVIDPVTASTSGDQPISISATNWEGGYQATAHLIELGHRRIGFAGGRPGSRPAGQRLHGYLAALEDHQIAVDRGLVRRRGFSHEDGRTMAEEILTQPDPPTAVVAGCDTSALGVMEAARMRGLRLPQDLSIVGFDDAESARWTSPQLTTVRQPMDELGRQALQTLRRLAAGGRPESPHMELATTLVVRTSTCPPAASPG